MAKSSTHSPQYQLDIRLLESAYRFTEEKWPTSFRLLISAWLKSILKIYLDRSVAYNRLYAHG